MAGKCFIPKGIALCWYSPFGVANSEHSFALSVNGISQNPFNKSNFDIYFECPILSMQSSILGIGNESLFVTAFNFR